MRPNSIDLCVELFAHNIAIRRNLPPAIIKQKLVNSQKVSEFYQKNSEDFEKLLLFFESKNIDYVEYFDIIFIYVNKEIYQPLFLIIKENYNTYLEHTEKTKIAGFNNEFFKSLRFFVDKCKHNNFKSFGDYTNAEVVVGVMPLPKCFKDIMQGNMSKHFFVIIPGISHYLKCWPKDILNELGFDGFDFEHLTRIGLQCATKKFGTYGNYIKCVSDMIM